MKKSADYWRARFEKIENGRHKEAAGCYQDIEKQFQRAQRSIEGQLYQWYSRFSNNNSVSLQEAKKLLSGRELKEFKWDVEDYIRYAKDNQLGDWTKKLENASARYHVSRLEALKLHIQNQIEIVYGNQLDSLDEVIRSIYTDGYYRTAFEIQKGIGVAWDLAKVNDDLLTKILHRPWAPDGKDFSSRIWANKNKLLHELDANLTQGLILGESPQKIIEKLSKRMEVSKAAAGRLVMTESAAFSSEAQKNCFSNLDVEHYEIVATLDLKTSEICQDMDGKVFKMSEWDIGATAPPFHVYCRTTTAPFFDDDIGERAARGPDGKTYMVPSDMTYREWKQDFVDGGEKKELVSLYSPERVKEEFRKINSSDIADIDKKVAEQFCELFDWYDPAPLVGFDDSAMKVTIEPVAVGRYRIKRTIKNMAYPAGDDHVDIGNAALANSIHERIHDLVAQTAMEKVGIKDGDIIGRIELHVFYQAKEKIEQGVFIYCFEDETYDEIIEQIVYNISERAGYPHEFMPEAIVQFLGKENPTNLSRKVYNYLKGVRKNVL